MIYELAPGVLIATPGNDPAGGKHVLDEHELEDARSAYAEQPTKKNLAELAHKLGAEPYDPPEPGVAPQQIAVDLAPLREALGDDRVAELAGIDAALLRQLAGDQN